jgi:hypothetical protein
LQKFDNYTGFEKNANFFRRKWQRLALRISKTKQKYSTLKNAVGNYNAGVVAVN